MQIQRSVLFCGLLTWAVISLGMNVACSNGEEEQHEKVEMPTQVDLRAASEDAVRNASSQRNQALAAKDVDKIVSFYADDATLFPPNAGMSGGLESIHAAWVAIVTTPGFALSNTTMKIEAAQSGDLAYETGRYLLTTKVKGALQDEKGKYVVVWKKQNDGSWKVVADIFNADQ